MESNSIMRNVYNNFIKYISNRIIAKYLLLYKYCKLRYTVLLNFLNCDHENWISSKSRLRVRIFSTFPNT